MNYQESRAYIDDAARYGAVLGLENMREMLKRLGNPQDDLQFIHVAGTNGKGSVIAYLYSVLCKAGYHVGRYISPTLYSYRERMEAAGERISRETFAECITRIAEVIRDMTEEGLPHPTPFEIETAAAFLFFQKEKCSPVLLEVGMGGDLDATNIIKNTKLAVLVSISMDHMEFLGDTLGKIAEKKAGIIKPGCHVVSALQKPEAAEAIRKRCELLEVPYRISDSKEAELTQESVFGQSFLWKGEPYQISLSGVYQKENAVLALNALEILDQIGFSTTLEQKKQGLKEAVWKGRFTVLQKEPLFVVDGAHNPAAADMMAASIEHYFKGRKLYYIMGVFADKDYRSVIAKTAHYAKKIFTIQTPDNPRALDAGKLAEAVRAYNKNAEAMNSISDAVEAALAEAKADDVILAFGSLSFIGTMTDIMEKRKETKNDGFAAVQK